MWMRSALRDLLDEIATASPGLARQRSRAEAQALMLAAFGPPEGEPDPLLRARIARAVDALIEDRTATPRPA